MKPTYRIVAGLVSAIAILSTLIATPAYAATAPDAPTNFQMTAGLGQLSMSWTAPANNGGSPITTYFISGYVTSAGTTTSELKNVGNVTSFVWDTATPVGAMNLVSGTNYTFRVWAFNAIGQSLLSNSASATPLGLPGAPTGMSAAAGNSQAQLGWTAPSNTGGATISDYLIEYSSDGGSVWSTFSHAASGATTATVTGLTNGTSYLFRVSAINSVGTGTASTTASATPTVTTFVPAAPTGLSASAGDTQVQLGWTVPFSDGGAAISDYLIEFSSDGGSVWSTFSHAPSTTESATVTGLINGTSYLFRVSAINSVGTGTASTTASATPATVPDAPTGLVAGPGNGQVSLSWAAPAIDGGSPVSGYSVAMSTDGGATFLQSANIGNSTSHTWTGLTNGSTYVFEVAATNSSGTGAFSGPQSAAPAIGLSGCPGGATPFTDIAGSFAESDVACIYGLEITTGTSATTYSPGNYVTREQMAAFLARTWRALGRTCASGATPFTDIAGSFAESDVACIYGLGITTGTSATTYSPGNYVTREQMAAFLARTVGIYNL